MSQFLQTLSNTERGKRADLLVFGFIHDEQIKQFSDDIVIECLKYYFINYAWDPHGYSEDNMKLDEENSIITMVRCGNASAYLTDILENTGIHTIVFKILGIKHSGWVQTNGIWKVNENNEPLLCHDFAPHGPDSIAINNTGNAVACGAFQFKQKEYNDCPAIVKDDIVEMIVDFEQNELRFKINGIDYGKAGDINPAHKYRPAVSLFYSGDAIQLLS